MDIQKRIDIAMGGRGKGYACSQCVVCAFSDLLDTDEKDLFKMAEGFGGGVGGLMEVCGVVCAMAMIAGLMTSGGNIENNTTKVQTIDLTRKLAMEFKDRNGTIICRELRGEDTGTPIRDCDLCIQDGIRIIAKHFFADRVVGADK
ncbi:C-GCAxxG-C-C family protein [Parasporobacterium paucivorans]|uniref:C_GCAxxG_C_C family probable redox protein n=1 Tax=Parasporobacterium paucivorans DSM 15970 TaxID=1122934 RepID=A0A1M6GXE7_9FIRM|nr:C-GCAxxG-C-C family protein [Parasporobacterium paucivorans]SHJ14616.1 C_GCAxxG_C_C family probable redox protein [Parasporobacterium paucivorans DSM 15970]